MRRASTVTAASLLCVIAAAVLTDAASAASRQSARQPAPTPDTHIAATYTLTLEGARAAGEAAARYAQDHGAGGAIAVVDSGGALLYLVRLDNTFPAASEVAIAKARTAATFRKPTQAFENAIREGRFSLTAVAPLTPLEGGIPIVIDGQVVGAVGCSGAMSSTQDVEVAQAGVAAVAN